MNTKEKNKQLEEARMRKINMKIFPIYNAWNRFCFLLCKLVGEEYPKEDIEII